MALVEKKINVAYESSVQEALSKVANVADKTTLDQVLATVTELKESGGSGELMPANADTIRLALLSNDVLQNDWGFKQSGIGAIINDIFGLNSEDLSGCDTVNDIAGSPAAIEAISGNTQAVYMCAKNNTLAAALESQYDDESILAAGLGHLRYNVGDIIQLTYGGVKQPFVVAHKNYMTQNKIVLVSVDVLDKDIQYKAPNNYSSSALRTYLNSTMLTKFSAEIQSAMVVSPVPCHNYTTEITCNDKMWALSGTEVGFTGVENMPEEGRIMDAFKGDSKLRMKDVRWWLRTPGTSKTYNAFYVNTDGSSDIANISGTLKCGMICAFEI